MIDPPSNFQYNITDFSISWDAVPEAIEYRISYSVQGMETWTTVNSVGDLNKIPFSKPSGNYDTKGETRQKTGLPPLSGTHS